MITLGELLTHQNILFALLLVVCFYAHHIYKSWRVADLNKIPGPSWFHFPTQRLTYLNAKGIGFQYVQKTLHPKYGPFVRLGFRAVFVADREAIKQILVTDEQFKTIIYEKLRRDNISTLFNATDKEIHKQRRRILAPAFSIKYIQALEPSMHKCLQDLVTRIDTEILEASLEKSAIINVAELLKCLGLDIIGETAFGGSFNLVRTGSNSIIVDKIFWTLRKRIVGAAFPFLKPFLQTDQYLQDFVRKLIKERRQPDQPQKFDLLQILVDATDREDQNFTDDDLFEQVSEFLIAGSDTTSFITQMALLHLVENPEKMKTLIEELDKDLADLAPSELPSNEVLKRIPYLNGVVNEALRLWPVALTNGIPKVSKDKDIVLGGYLIPKGIAAVANIYQLHHSRELWGDDVEEFVPERWLNPERVPRDAFYPFSAGSRNCIGNNFALQEIRLILAIVLTRYRIEEIPGQDKEIVQFLTPSLKTMRYDVRFSFRSRE